MHIYMRIHKYGAREFPFSRHTITPAQAHCMCGLTIMTNPQHYYNPTDLTSRVTHDFRASLQIQNRVCAVNYFCVCVYN